MYTVEPIFNDSSNSDNCCYNDRFVNPHFSFFWDIQFTSGIRSIEIAFFCYCDNHFWKFESKTERNAIQFCQRKRSQAFRLAVPSSQAQLELTVPYSSFGLASPINITQGFTWLSVLWVTSHSQTRSARLGGGERGGMGAVNRVMIGPAGTSATGYD